MTVAELIAIALRKTGAIESSETPSSTEQSQAFTELNGLMGSWAVKGIPVTPFAAVTDEIPWDDEYTRAMWHGLAVELAPEYGLPVTPYMAKLAEDSYDELYNSIDDIPDLKIDTALLPRTPFDITNG